MQSYNESADYQFWFPGQFAVFEVKDSDTRQLTVNQEVWYRGER